MEQYYIGEAIRKKRKSLKLSQSQLAEGICERLTISRLENGLIAPSHRVMTALLERLDLPADKYITYLSNDEKNVELLCRKITAGNVRYQSSKGENRAKIRKEIEVYWDELEKICNPEDTLIRQILECSRLIVGEEGVPLTQEEKRKRLKEIIKLTNPAFDIKHIDKGLYSTNDIKIINQLGVTYIKEKRHMDAIRLYEQLFGYIREHFVDISPTRVYLTMILFNYSQELTAIGEYQYANEIANYGYELCVTYGHYQYLPGLLGSIAESFYFLGEIEKSKEFYTMAYNLCRVIKDDVWADDFKNDAWRYLQISL